MTIRIYFEEEKYNMMKLFATRQCYPKFNLWYGCPVYAKQKGFEIHVESLACIIFNMQTFPSIQCGQLQFWLITMIALFIKRSSYVLLTDRTVQDLSGSTCQNFIQLACTNSFAIICPFLKYLNHANFSKILLLFDYFQD